MLGNQQVGKLCKIHFHENFTTLLIFPLVCYISDSFTYNLSSFWSNVKTFYILLL